MISHNECYPQNKTKEFLIEMQILIKWEGAKSGFQRIPNFAWFFGVVFSVVQYLGSPGIDFYPRIIQIVLKKVKEEEEEEEEKERM